MFKFLTLFILLIANLGLAQEVSQHKANETAKCEAGVAGRVIAAEKILPFAIDTLKDYQSNNFKFKCESKTIKGCEYDYCEAPAGLLKSYPKEIAFLLPKKIQRIENFRVHFHGYTTFQNNWDKSLASLVDEFEIGSSSCKNPKELTIIPFSKNNKNTHHLQYLNSQEQFSSFIKEIENILWDNHTGHSITLSGHSGGGKIVGNIIKSYKNPNNLDDKTFNKFKVKEVQIYDGLYSQVWADNILKWYQANDDVKLKLYGIEGTTPAKWSNYLFNKAQNKDAIKYEELEKSGGAQHWELLRDSWNN